MMDCGGRCCAGGGGAARRALSTTPVDVAGIKLEKKARKVQVNWIAPEGMEDSLIPETLAKMETDPTFKMTAAQLKDMGAVRLSREERQRRRRALDALGVPSFADFTSEVALRLGGPSRSRSLAPTLTPTLNPAPKP
mmetsp:Transcript_43366/g.135833  ORF Transcript_43366/g.135833 Transcript_43366/m.135833 type:complete len:137 (+) Transcript_43366:103-513(+)